MINVTRSSMPPFEEYCAEIRDLWDSRWLTNMGEKHRQLQKKLAEYLGAEHMELVTNGHMALELSLQALELKGEVITTPFTFASTTHAIVRSGLTPMFCDIDPETWTMDPSKIEALITEHTCAILPVHVYGNFCDVEAIREIARRHGLKVVYDAAHAFGAKYKGMGAGAFGDVSCFSFHATKVFHTVEGGGVSCRDEVFGERLKLLRNFGISGPEQVDAVGGNAKLDEFRAAMGLCNLRHLENEIAAREKAALRYRERLEGVKGLRLAPVQRDVQPNYAYFPVVFDGFPLTRDEVFERLLARGVTARKYFYPLTNCFACYRELPTAGAEKTPIAAHIAERVLCLPLYAGLEPETVDRICGIILEKETV